MTEISLKLGYKGQLKNGIRNGIGSYVYPNNYFRYEGEWLNGIKHGKGKLIMKNGSFYEGQFCDGEINGLGYHFYALSGTEYRGQFASGERNGFGCLIYKNKDKFEGEWLNNKKHGTGALICINGVCFNGVYYHDKRNGDGKLKHDKISLEGVWVNDVLEGSAVLIIPQICFYQGNFKNNIICGNGDLKRAIGLPDYSGPFKDGETLKKAARLGLTMDLLFKESTNSNVLNKTSITFEKIKLTLEQLLNNFMLTVGVYTEDNNLLIEEENRYLLLWFAQQVPLENLKEQVFLSNDAENLPKNSLLAHFIQNPSTSLQLSRSISVCPIGSIQQICEHPESIALSQSTSRELSQSSINLDNLIVTPQTTNVENVQSSQTAVPLSSSLSPQSQISYLQRCPLVYKQTTNGGFASWACLSLSLGTNRNHLPICLPTLPNVSQPGTTPPLKQQQRQNSGNSSAVAEVSQLSLEGNAESVVEKQSGRVGRSSKSTDTLTASELIKIIQTNNLFIIVEDLTKDLSDSVSEVDHINVALTEAGLTALPSPNLVNPGRLAPLVVQIIPTKQTAH